MSASRVKISAICFIFVSIALLAPNMLYAKGWATVDYTLLLALHPKMAWYDFSTQRFYRSDVPLGNAKEMEKLQKKADAAAAELQNRVADIERRRNRILQELGKIDEQRRTTTNEMLREGKDIKSIEESFEKKKASLQKEFENLDKEYMKLQDAKFDTFYLSRDESRKYLLNIMAEIDSWISRIAREKGNLAILDRSFVFPPMVEYQAPQPTPVSNLMEANLYAQLLQSDFQPPAGTNDPSAPPGHKERILSGLEERFQEKFQQFLTQVPALQAVIQNLRARLFLTGGEDLTAEVLSRIFENYKVPTEVSSRVLRMIPQLE